MKKLLKILTCVAVITSCLLSLVSCVISDYFNNKVKTYWVETYEEAMDIIEVLKSYGNEIPRHVISSYENDYVDAKYRFIVNTTDTAIKKPGEKWYERKFYSVVAIDYYGFLGNVSTEEAMSYAHPVIFFEGRDLPEDFVIPKSVICECKDIEENEFDYDCFLKNGDDGSVLVIPFYYNIKNHAEELPENFHEEFAKSLVFLVN